MLVVALQLTLLVLVTFSWTEKMKTDTLPHNLAYGPIPKSQGCADPDYAWSLVALALTNIGALCALALYTHAEAQQAVDLFEQLVKPCTDSSVQEPSECSCWHILVPTLQLLVALFTLFVQGLVFQNYSGKVVQGGPKYGQIMESVFASVGLAFICELDNRAWVLLEPLMPSTAAAVSVGAPASITQDSLLISLCQWGFYSRLSNSLHCCCASTGAYLARRLPHSGKQLHRAAAFCSRCCKWGLTGFFHVVLFAYECAFGTFLLQYATDFILINCPGQRAFAALLGVACFVTFQLVAGVRSRPIARAAQPRVDILSRCCTLIHMGWLPAVLQRPVVLNLLAPVIVAAFSRALYATFGINLVQSSWRCDAGAVLGCTSCNVTAEWCTFTSACAGVCLNASSAAQAHFSGRANCTNDWCNNQSCRECLLKSNGSSMPVVDINTSIKDSGLLMFGGMKCYFWWMHLWTTFLPVILTVVLAVLFLLYEGTCCKCQRVQDSSDLFACSSLQKPLHAEQRYNTQQAGSAAAGTGDSSAAAAAGMVSAPTSKMYPPIAEA